MPSARRTTLVTFAVVAVFLAMLHVLGGTQPITPIPLPDGETDFANEGRPFDGSNATFRALTPEEDPFRPGVPKPSGEYSRVLVVPRMAKDDVSWIEEELPDLETAIYVMDDPSAPLHPPVNKGRESMAYLTYIIDHYDSLPDVVLFFHAHRIGWHNLLIMGQDTAEMLKRLRSERVWRVGYFPARCDHKPGCPDWLHLDRPEVDFDEHLRMEEKHYTPEIWRQLHPPGLGGMGEAHRVPGVLSAPCCAQFGVSSERIRANPKELYEHYRNWLIETDLDDQYAGRVMEYTWHYIFTRAYQFCPSEHTCYCDGYGICFGSEKAFDVYKHKEERKWDIWDRLGNAEKLQVPSEEVDALREELKHLDSQMSVLRDDAIARGESEDARRAERERIPLH